MSRQRITGLLIVCFAALIGVTGCDGTTAPPDTAASAHSNDDTSGGPCADSPLGASLPDEDDSSSDVVLVAEDGSIATESTVSADLDRDDLAILVLDGSTGDVIASYDHATCGGVADVPAVDTNGWPDADVWIVDATDGTFMFGVRS